MSSREDIWDWRPSGAKCTGKHTWNVYLTFRFRECHDCGTREKLWADFGFGRIGLDDEQDMPEQVKDRP